MSQVRTAGARPELRRSDGFHGTGMLRQTAGRGLEFVLYARESVELGEEVEISERAGEIIGPASCYTLTATDLLDRHWSAERLLPSAQRHFSVVGTVFEGRLREIRCRGEYERAQGESDERRLAFSRDSIELYAFQRVEAPATSSTRSVTEGPLGRWTRNHLDAAEVPVYSGRGVLRMLDDHAVFRLSAEGGALPTNAPLQVREALQFVLGAPVRWSFIRERRARLVTLTVSGHPPERADQAAKPPTARNVVHSEVDTWRLFGCYLDFLRDQATDGTHPITEQYDAVLRSRRAPMETQALVLCIAVERVCRIVSGAHKTSVAGALSDWGSRVSAFLDEAQCPEPIRSRITKAVEALRHPRPHDILHALVLEGRLNEDHVGTWKRTRPLVAHGSFHSFKNVQRASLQLDAILTLLHQLIFHALAYEGTFTDFGQLGWPLATYPPRRAAEEQNNDGAREFGTD